MAPQDYIRLCFKFKLHPSYQELFFQIGMYFDLHASEKNGVFCWVTKMIKFKLDRLIKVNEETQVNTSAQRIAC